MQFWSQYSTFLAKFITIIIGLLVFIGGIIVMMRLGKTLDKNKIDVKKLNKKYAEYADTLQAEILSKSQYKKEQKKLAKAEKETAKNPASPNKKRIFVLQFHGDLKASSVNALREEITAILQVATPSDEVIVCLESPGGLVSPYGLAASQLQRFREKHIPLTIAIDKVAASGGYLMACVANQIIAAPFAIVGSIGVIAQLPNFHRLLKKKEIDFEQITAGQFKRTLTLFGENTPERRQKMQQDIEEIHSLFKDFIQQNRPQVNLQQVATGEHWLAAHALDLKLVDKLITSDDYLLNASDHADIYQIKYTSKKTLSEKISSIFTSLLTSSYLHG